jgi:hypothetical protein
MPRQQSRHPGKYNNKHRYASHDFKSETLRVAAARPKGLKADALEIVAHGRSSVFYAAPIQLALAGKGRVLVSSIGLNQRRVDSGKEGV